MRLEAALLGREHERVRNRMTGQSLVEAVAGDQSAGSHFDTDIDVRVTSQLLFS